MSGSLEAQAVQARQDWTADDVRRLFGVNLGKAWAIGQAIRLAVLDNEITGSTGEGVFITGPHAESYRLTERTETGITLLYEGSLELAQAHGIAHLANTAWLSMPLLVSSASGEHSLRAFRAGLHVGVELIVHFAAQRGIDPSAAGAIAQDVCVELGLPRANDLAALLAKHGWDEERSQAAAIIHSRLLAVGCPGLDLDEAQQLLRGGPDARAGLDRMEAEQGIDVSVMREAITYVPHDYPGDDLESLCEAHELIVRRGLGEDESSPDGLPQWEWVSADGAQVSNLYFGSEREARIAALEEKLLPEWFAAGQYEMDFPDFMEAARPGSSNRP